MSDVIVTDEDRAVCRAFDEHGTVIPTCERTRLLELVASYRKQIEDRERARLAGAWVVRELEWRETPSFTETEVAETVIGELCVRLKTNGECYVFTTNNEYHDGFATKDAAKAAAQEWYESRLTAGLRRAGG